MPKAPHGAVPITTAVFLAGACLTPAPASAQTAQTAQTAPNWRWSVTPYLWLAGPKGHVAAVPALANGGGGAGFDVTFKDVLSHLSSAFVGKAEVGYGRFGVIADVDYVKLHAKKDIQVGRLPAAGAEAALSSTLATVAAYYRVYDTEDANIDLLAGARYNGGKIALNLAGAGGSAAAGDASKSWVDPIVGVRGMIKVSRRGALTGYVDAGAGASQSVWQVLGAYNFAVNRTVTLSAGYRYYAVDFHAANFKYNLQLGGPLVAATFNF